MTDGKDQGGGLNDAALASATDDRALSGTGGSEGGGTTAGAGEPSGGDADRAGLPMPEEAAAAAALGPSDGSLADAEASRGPGGTTMGDALRGVGRDMGSGTPADRGDLGGGDPKR